MPANSDGKRFSNSDPITGQAGWYDVRVRIYPAGADQPAVSSPQFAALETVPGMDKERPSWHAWFAGQKGDVQ